MHISPNSKLLFIGDSITDCGREHPVGEGAGIGNGYVSQVKALLASTYPHNPIRVVNVGTSGQTIRDLDARWQRDVLDLRPDWLSIMIGINDVWRQFDQPLQTEDRVSLDEYSATLERLIQTTLPHVKGLVLMTPYFIEPNLMDPMRAMMDQYGAAVRKLSITYKTLFVDTQAAFDAALVHTHPMAIALDRVHPGLPGHMLIARAFLTTLGYAW
jgi:lysophospholipase L1-like esterase